MYAALVGVRLKLAGRGRGRVTLPGTVMTRACSRLDSAAESSKNCQRLEPRSGQAMRAMRGMDLPFCLSTSVRVRAAVDALSTELPRPVEPGAGVEPATSR